MQSFFKVICWLIYSKKQSALPPPVAAASALCFCDLTKREGFIHVLEKNDTIWIDVFFFVVLSHFERLYIRSFKVQSNTRHHQKTPNTRSLALNKNGSALSFLKIEITCQIVPAVLHSACCKSAAPSKARCNFPALHPARTSAPHCFHLPCCGLLRSRRPPANK